MCRCPHLEAGLDAASRVAITRLAAAVPERKTMRDRFDEVGYDGMTR